MKISFLLSHIPNPRMYKRITALSQQHDVSVVCVRRTNQDIFALRDDLDIPHYIMELNLPSFKNVIGRMKASKVYRAFALSKLKEINPDVIYTEGMDSLMVANSYYDNQKVKIIYEVADLRESFIKEVSKEVKQAIIDWYICRKERKLFKYVSLLVVTSMKFYEAHYSAFFPRNRVFELPNMPSLKPFERYKPKDHTNNFTIGFIGGFRYPQQMQQLVDAAKKSNVNVVFAGGAADTELMNFVDEVSKQSHVQFLGKYDYNKDIARLYGLVDCVYSVYNADNPNVRIALPNKLYESIYCRLPIIVAKKTYLSDLVKDWSVGVAVSHTDENELAAVLAKLRDNKDFYEECVLNCESRKYLMDAQIYLDKLSEIMSEIGIGAKKHKALLTPPANIQDVK